VNTQIDSDEPNRMVLPVPDPPFRGESDVACNDSKADWPTPLRRRKARQICSSS
jgi:hypothetical protein